MIFGNDINQILCGCGPYTYDWNASLFWNGAGVFEESDIRYCHWAVFNFIIGVYVSLILHVIGNEGILYLVPASYNKIVTENMCIETKISL